VMPGDLIRMAGQSVRRARLRSAMLLLAMGIGVSAVVVLSALGEGARRFVTDEFRSLGTHLIIVFPGRSETTGVQPGLFSGETPRDLTLGDAEALLRVPGVERVAPLVIGAAPASARALEREAPILGSTADLLAVRHWRMSQGEFLPPGELDRDVAVCVIGANVRRELFAGRNALGESLRIGDRRFRVIGVLASEGRSIGMDVQELVIIPVRAAQALFNSDSLFRILVQTRTREAMERVRDQVIETLAARHQGERDVTVVTQDSVLSTFDVIFTALTLALAGIASISLAVAGVLVMNVMLVAVSQRTAEVGLLRAVGATRRQVTALFLTEAVLLSLAGAVAGIVVGLACNWIVGRIYPDLPLTTPPWALALAVLTALASGVGFGLMPARRAARLDPVLALSGRR
jgi:putative ABC transport system permease protein